MQYKSNSISLVHCLSVVLMLTSVAQGSGLRNGSAHRRANRLLKAREPLPQDGTVGAAAAPPPGGSAPYVTYDPVDILHLHPITVTPTPTPAVTPSSTKRLSASTATPLASKSASLITPSSAVQPSNSSTLASSSLSSTESSSSHSSSASSSSTASHTSSSSSATSAAPLSSAVDQGPTTVTFLVPGSAPSTSAKSPTSDTDNNAVPTGAATLSTSARNVLIALGAIVVGIIVIWAVIRRIRYTKSNSRMQPIDWNPNMEESSPNPVANNRLSSASSFHSGSGHRDMYNNTSDLGHGHYDTTPNSDREFVSSAPIGGYADLARGPSPPHSVYDHYGAAPTQAGQYDYNHGPRY